MEKRIAVTLGNPNGIGPEVVFKAIQSPDFPSNVSLTLIGDSSTYSHYKNAYPVNQPHTFIPIEVADFRFVAGGKTALSGEVSYRCLERAVAMAKANEIDAIVTAPLSKELVIEAGHPDFIDHTTFLSKAYNSENYNMMFFSRDLKVILTTIHIPLSQVTKDVNEATLRRTILNAVHFCQSYYRETKPWTIGVCGLNPHAGEGGHIGREEIDFIRPVVLDFQKRGFSVEGPLPSDTVFYSALHGAYDMVVAHYHDVGLAPFKLLHFHDGVNITLGLPVVRTSPDHGTAFDIAGKGIADASSMLESFKLASVLLSLD